ncbi:U-box domain-containing protein [Legionella septentrionalis]|uniref:U-box domain-containing protein n=1 Tax=Legionella septentrionalis TaxID=2498109 RepID=UPI000FBA3739|nr:U-box domain-containing protein [Legionella septentrionalis]RUR17435.1 hypothetical protein ELY10_00435 [Legionella septentrionalis]
MIFATLSGEKELIYLTKKAAMLFVVIELPLRISFNPFCSLHDDLFAFYKQIKHYEAQKRMPLTSYFTNYHHAAEHTDELSRRLSRYLVLEMVLNNRFEISNRPLHFTRSLVSATFHCGGLETYIQRERIENVYQPIHAVKPFSHIPTQEPSLVAKAQEVAKELGEDLPEEFLDPITAELLHDPVEINHRVYNRQSVEHMIEEGKFKDPFTRQKIDPATMKSASYMLEAMVAHREVVANKKEPALMEAYKQTKVLPLKTLFKHWEELIHNSSMQLRS